MAALRKDVTQLSGSEQDRLVRGFQALMALPPSDPDSFSTIASYHGLPGGNGVGYCQHENMLFPLWHRGYILRLERALRKALGDDTFAMPFWNETSPSSAQGGLPSIFTSKTYSWSDGSGSVPNPLFSYKLQVAITDTDSEDTGKLKDLYTKPVGYETVRYPWSGIVEGTYAPESQVHNAAVAELPETEITSLLNQNIITWLTKETYTTWDKQQIPAGELDNFNACLKAPNYPVFSNTSTAGDWNDQHPSASAAVVTPLEQPHNAIHLAVGGYEVPSSDGSDGTLDQYPFANGDMGENDTAAYDPVFYFHHCFIDYMFYQWQVLNDQTTTLTIPDDTLALSGVSGYSLTDDLDPFSALEVNGKNRPLQPVDIIDISTLAYSYPPVNRRLHQEPDLNAPKLAVSNISRKDIPGSFLVTTWAKGEGNQPHRLLKIQPVLSRWDVSKCENCTKHLDVKSHVHLLDFTHEEAEKTKFFTLIHTSGVVGKDKLGDVGGIKVDLVTRGAGGAGGTA